MSAARSPALSVVEQAEPPLDIVPDIYAADRARIASIDWAGMHIRSDRSPAINLPHRIRRAIMSGGGVRKERGGFKFEERP